MIDEMNYELNFSIYVATRGHCYATLIKTDIHLIAFDRLVYRKIQLIALTLMTSSKARAPELRMTTIVSQPRECLKFITFREGCFVIRN